MKRNKRRNDPKRHQRAMILMVGSVVLMMTSVTLAYIGIDMKPGGLPYMMYVAGVMALLIMGIIMGLLGILMVEAYRWGRLREKIATYRLRRARARHARLVARIQRTHEMEDQILTPQFSRTTHRRLERMGPTTTGPDDDPEFLREVARRARRPKDKGDQS